MIDLPEVISPTNYRQLMLDVRVENHGTIFLVCPFSGRAARWIDEHVSGESQWIGCSLVVEHRYLRELVEHMCEAGLLVKVQPYTIPSTDQNPVERMRGYVLAVLESHMVVKVRQRSVPYTEIAHFRGDSIEFRKRERFWNRWRGKLIEIDAATCKSCLACGNACWHISGELKNGADRLFGRHPWTICAHQLEVDFPC